MPVIRFFASLDTYPWANLVTFRFNVRHGAAMNQCVNADETVIAVMAWFVTQGTLHFLVLSHNFRHRCLVRAHVRRFILARTPL